MGTGQTLLTIMAMMMLGRLILSVNTAMAQSGSAIEMAAGQFPMTIMCEILLWLE
jgi:hypothetical protein